MLAALIIAAAFPVLALPPAPPWQSPLAQDHPLVGRIWLPKDQKFIDPPELARRLAAADVVLLGERHDNPDHHRLQAWSLGEVIAAGRRPVVAFEMVGPEQAPALDRFRQDHPADVDGLAGALDWAHGTWPDWSNYRPLFAEAIGANLTIRPANLAYDTLRAVARGGNLSVEDRRRYRLDQPLDAATAEAMAVEIRESHCGQLPEPVVPAMVDVQRARDAAMAHAVADDAPNGAVLIAGTGHTRSDRGVPAHLAALAPGRSVFSLAFVEVADGRLDPAAYGDPWGSPSPPFDALWFTPRANDDDPCAAMTEFMRKKKEKVPTAQ